MFDMRPDLRDALLDSELADEQQELPAALRSLGDRPVPRERQPSKPRSE